MGVFSVIYLYMWDFFCTFAQVGINMTLQEAIKARHSVRQYLDKPIEAEKIAQLQALIDECNREAGVHIQLVTNEPNAFSGGLAKYGKFSGVSNYLAMIGKKGSDEATGNCGYDLQNHHHALADAEACAVIAQQIL